MRFAYLIAGLIIAATVAFNIPRFPWMEQEEGVPSALRFFVHGMIGFSYMGAWLLLVGGAYQLMLGVMYWDMDTSESERWQFTLESGGTARLLWGLGALTLLAGILWAQWLYRADGYLWPAGAMSTLGALLACWLLWLAFPLAEQVGIDREHVGV